MQDRAAFDQELSGVLNAMDQPSIDGVNTYFVAKLAAESGMKVALSGLGGDELLGGYPSFRDVPRLQKWLAQKGLYSRREAERMIAEGRFTINGNPAAVGAKLDPASDRVCLDRVPITAEDPVCQ